MNGSLKTILWHQFGAAIDMLENAITACPEELWNTGSQFWYIGYHTLFFLDYYLSDETPMEKDFSPPSPFTTSEFEDGVMPERVYDKEELLIYCRFGRQKLRELLERLVEEELLTKRFVSEYKNYCILEMLLYNMRHVQHHTAQLNLLLRQDVDAAPDWVSRTGAKF
jgi:hypothetical protein